MWGVEKCGGSEGVWREVREDGESKRRCKGKWEKDEGRWIKDRSVEKCGGSEENWEGWEEVGGRWGCGKKV